MLGMDMYKHRRERLNALINEHYGNSRVAFCEHTGLSESRLAQLLSNTYREGTAFTEKTARKLEQLAQLPPLYFEEGALFNTQQMTFDEIKRLIPDVRRVRAAEPGDPNLVQIPKVKLHLSAGITGFQVEPETYDGATTTVPAEWMLRNGFKKDKLLAIRVKGESMEPTFYESDLVVLNTADTTPVDGGVFAVNYEGEPVVKRMTRDAGDWWLTSDNLDQRRFSRKVCQGEACLIIGRVVRKESERF
jgi:phage repressor protein C with HTH and peptisase S24 domain